MRQVARRFRTTQREELEAELARKTLELKRKRPVGIRDWKAYLAKFLFNKSANWIRDARAREARLSSLDASPPEAMLFLFNPTESYVSEDARSEFRVGFAEFWNELPPELKEVCTLLVECKGNQLEVARRSRKHRNTIRLWIRKIQLIAARHGFNK